MSQAFGQLIMFNEREYQQLSEKKKPVFVYDWLKNFEESLHVASKADLKASHQELVAALTKQLYGDCGPSTRQLLGHCFASLYYLGDQFSAFKTVNTCSDIIKAKDDTSANQCVKLAAMAIIGAIFEKIGRMVGGTAPETVQVLIKAMKNVESQGRCEILLCCQRILNGLGSAASSCHRDIYKSIKTALVDRSMAVRCYAAECASELLKHANFTYTSELETLLSTCLKGLEGSNYDVRVCISRMLGKLMAATQRPPEGSTAQTSAKTKKVTMNEMFGLMSSGFLRGGIGFLKGGGGEFMKTIVPQEVRVGITQAYVVLFNEMGGTWVEKNIAVILTQILELLSNSKATQSHVDAVYSRKCVSFILRSMLGRLLGEKAQVIAGKELCKLVSRLMKKVIQVVQAGREANSGELEEILHTTQHPIICALQELACLVQDLRTAAGSLISEQTIEIVFSVLNHSIPATRLNAAWCLRTIAVAVPSQLTPLINRCVENLRTSTTVETVTGFAYSLSSLIGGVRHCNLGIPHRIGKLVFEVAEEMLKKTTEDTKWALPRAKCGWMLLGSLMTLGPSTVLHFLPKMLALWASAFPPTPDEAESEKKKGDACTWQVTLECRSGALAALSTFIALCPSLLSDDIIRRVMIPLEACVTMTTLLPAIIKQHGNHLKVSAAMIRLRMYETFLLLPPKSYDGLFNSLLRELVSEFTLTSNQSMTTTSYLRTMCHKDDSILLGTWLQETDHKSVEDQLQPNSASGSGALEHDYSCLFTHGEKSLEPPGPLPLGVAVIDASIKLFGKTFPHLPQKHKNQLLSHFATCIKSAKAAKAQAVTMNIFTAFLSALKSMGETKATFADMEVRTTADNLVMSGLNNSDPILRCAAAEALGRMAQVMDEPAYVAQIAQSIFAKIQGARDAISRTGHSIALGCLHRYVGGMGAGQHTQTSVSILLALAQDASSIVQVWALHALALIADCGGPMFRSYVEPTLEQCMSLLLSVPPSNTEIHQCIGKCLAALITSIGPELQDTSSTMRGLRSACLVAASVMQNHPDSLVQAEAISCLQQLHIFAPRHVNLSTLVPSLCTNLSSAHLILRRAAVACLRQLSQREAKEVCEHALACKTATEQRKSTYLVQIGDDGLEGALFGMLDTEVDRGLRSDIQDTLTSMLVTLAPHVLTCWLNLCKSVLSAAKSSDNQTPQKEEGKDDDDESGGMGAFSKVEETHPTVSPRWPTRVFASESVQRIMTVCEQKRAHFDLALARELKRETGEGDYLVMHLAELVRLAFIAATATSDQLKLEGLKSLQEIVRKFSTVSDPDYSGHVILEQFQAQVGAALRPAFAVDTPADVTAMACEVCSTWIASGVSYDLNDVRRIQQLLVTSLSKFGTEQDSSSQLYNESANTMEKLAVLKAWAQVYIVAMKQQNASSSSSLKQNGDYNIEQQEPLISLVTSHIRNLSYYWLGALKDYGYLSLPVEFAPQLPVSGGMFYSPESVNETRKYYQEAWPPILHAAALWLNAEGFANADKESENIHKGVLSPNTILSVPQAPKSAEQLNMERFHLLLGLCVKALCSTRLTYSADTITSCVHAVNTLLEAPWARNCLGADNMLSVELLNVLHRLLLTRDSLASHAVIMSTVLRVVQGTRDVAERQRASAAEHVDTTIGETQIEAGKSVVFGALETCMCLLTRYFPTLISDSETAVPSPRLSAHSKGASSDFNEILSTTVSVLSLVPDLCTSQVTWDVLPIVLRLITCVLEEAASYEVPLVEAENTVAAPKMPSVVTSSLIALKGLLTSQRLRNPKYLPEFVKLFQSGLFTIIEATKVEDNARHIDDSSIMAVITMFVLAAPREVTAVIGLHQDCVDIFIRCINSTNEKVQLKAVQTCVSLFNCPDLTRIIGFIHSLGPHIIAVIEQAATKSPTSETQLQVCQQAIDIVELLVALADEAQRTDTLSLFLPLLVNLLLDSSSSAVTKYSRALHEFAFQKLLSIGPKYPQPFKTIMSSSPHLKQRLELAVRSNQAKSNTSSVTQAKPAASQPKIKLKMDFSNFK